MNYVIPVRPVPAVPIAGSDALFPVRRIYCVGRNYADHAREMGHDPSREPPFFFSKPADAIVPIVSGIGEVAYPPATTNLQHEVEMVAALGKGGANIPLESALDCVFGYAVGFDLTRRDLQSRAKDKGHPWDMGKGFDQSAPISALRPVGAGRHATSGKIVLTVNGELRQQADLKQMIWSLGEVIANLSTYLTLQPGDLIFTGTPGGVATIVKGDVLVGYIDGIGELSARLV